MKEEKNLSRISAQQYTVSIRYGIQRVSYRMKTPTIKPRGANIMKHPADMNDNELQQYEYDLTKELIELEKSPSHMAMERGENDDADLNCYINGIYSSIYDICKVNRCRIKNGKGPEVTKKITSTPINPEQPTIEYESKTLPYDDVDGHKDHQSESIAFKCLHKGKIQPVILIEREDGKIEQFGGMASDLKSVTIHVNSNWEANGLLNGLVEIGTQLDKQPNCKN